MTETTPAAYPPGDPDGWSLLCIAVGGSTDSWTGLFLRLVQKSDPAHKEALRRASPALVDAFDAWYTFSDGYGAGVKAAEAAWWARSGKKEFR